MSEDEQEYIRQGQGRNVKGETGIWPWSGSSTRSEFRAHVEDALTLVEDEVTGLELDALVFEEVVTLVILSVTKHRTSLFLLGQVVTNVNGAALTSDSGVLTIDFGEWQPLVNNYKVRIVRKATN